MGPSTFILFIALDCDHSHIAMDESMNFIIGPGQRPLYISCYNVDDPDCSPSGTTLVTIVDYQNGERWLSIPPQRYCDTKYERAEKILAQVEKYYPGFREHIEEIEVATPLTNVRFTRAPGGAIGGFNHYSKHYYLFPMDRPRIKGLHFAGAWTNNPGGFHPTLMNGRAVGLDIIEKERNTVAGVQV
jgi:phytoene dehydrogenase-like protein